MNVTSTRCTQHTPPLKVAPKASKEEAAKRQEDAYTGPADRKSHPDLEWQATARPWLRKLHSTMVRKSPIKGLEHLPMSGPHVYAPTHQSGIDPGLFFDIGVEDVRFMGAEEQFVGQQGGLFTKMGAFPVDRENPGSSTLKHSKDILKKEKAGLLAFPEGGIFGDGSDGKVHPLKEGPAYMAILGKAESIVPIAIHVGKDTETRLGESAVGALLAAGAGAASVLAMSGGPVTRVIAGTVSGALLGAATSTTVFGKDTWNPYADVIQETKIGAAGAIVGGIIGGLTASQFNSGFLGLAAGGATAAATLTAANAFIHRPVAKMEVMKPLDVAQAVKEHGPKKARGVLTGQIYDALSVGKHRLVFGDKPTEA